MSNPYAPLMEIMSRRGVQIPVEQFHQAVNVTFHQFEAEVYDQEHQDMWEEVPRQIHKLIADCALTPQSSLRLLDIGCGTGLATDSVLNSPLGKSISSVTLLDTSPRMLELARQRAARHWKVPVETFNGITTDFVRSLAPDSPRFDVVVTCSVLHHVPDTVGFLHDVRQLQPAGGIFLHVQDPNGDWLNDPVLAERTRRATPPPDTRVTPQKLWKRLKRMAGQPDVTDYLDRANRELLARGVITSALTAHELYAITDIHVLDGLGASIRRMREWLPDYELVSQRAYGFFGTLPLHLSPELRAEEEQLAAKRESNGFHIGAAWRRK